MFRVYEQLVDPKPARRLGTHNALVSLPTFQPSPPVRVQGSGFRVQGSGFRV